jgi:hypothetical protein
MQVQPETLAQRIGAGHQHFIEIKGLPWPVR